MCSPQVPEAPLLPPIIPEWLYRFKRLIGGAVSSCVGDTPLPSHAARQALGHRRDSVVHGGSFGRTLVRNAASPAAAAPLRAHLDARPPASTLAFFNELGLK